MVQVSRRGFVSGAVGAIGLFAIGGGAVFADKAATSDGAKAFLRPPGGQDEERFLANCVKCNRCRSVCPRGVVVTAQVEDGVVVARTPLLDFHRGYCDFCGECIEVCPTAALVAFDETEEKLGLAVVDVDECLAWAKGSCRKCVDVCPYQAISLDESGRPIVDEDACNGCGACEHACPSASFGSYSGSGVRGINVVAGGEGDGKD